jgi:hypothetical protein
MVVLFGALVQRAQNLFADGACQPVLTGMLL